MPLIRPSAKAKKIQFATININDSTQEVGLTATTTISSVDTTNTIIFTRTIKAGSSNSPYGAIGVQLTNSTTITASYKSRGGGTQIATVLITVVEFYPGLINSIQYVPGSPNPATISSVNMSKTAVISLCVLGYLNQGDQGATLTSATSVTVPASYYAAEYRWAIVEFK